MDPFEVLGVEPGASLEEIEAAYRSQIRAWHPDVHQHAGAAAIEAAVARTTALNQAILVIRRAHGGRSPGIRPPTGVAWTDDWFGPPPPAETSAWVPCPACGQPFAHLADYQEHLVRVHRLSPPHDRASRASGAVFWLLDLVGHLRFVPVWLALVLTGFALVLLPLTWSPLPLALLALTVWAQTSSVFRSRR